MSSVVRAPQIDLASILKAQNPQIDLRLPAYEASTRNFLKAVSDYANRATAEITQRRTQHSAEKKRISEKVLAIETETNQCKVKEIELVATLEREQEETKEAESSVAALRRQLTSIREACTALDMEIEQYRATTSNLRREREGERATLETHASNTTPELYACERGLRCVIEGVGKDQLLVRFSHIDPSNPRREASFVLDVSARSYKVLTSTPSLPILPILLDRLNDTRDIFRFIKEVREGFRETFV
ncbi:hypothetical protein BV25DRAFT_1915389 [Artomyces pyxidatus]|uniref:Uncharacterized protein n=1 Tax=Artomyces pyxidatus TaxID=48021 RepID=A0ACB8T3U1_9AGAM|nr:hypothetical protein BV25DRAFT_1915389 [Artomyces pyxidatus]